MFRTGREVGVLVLFMPEVFVGSSDYRFFSLHRSPNPPDSGPSPVTWPKFTEQEQAHLVIDVNPRVEHRFREQKVAFWNEVVPKLLEVTQVKLENLQDQTAKDEL